MEYADEVMDFLKRYHSDNGQSENLGVISKKAFYSRVLLKGEHIGSFLATIYDDGQKLNLKDEEIIELIFSKGTLPESWASLLDGIKLNDKYRSNWFNLRVALIDHGISKGYSGEISNNQSHKSAREQVSTKEAMDTAKADTRTCFFCKKPGHLKPNCTKYIEWKKKNPNKVNEASRQWSGEKFSPKKMTNSINRNLFTISRTFADVVKANPTAKNGGGITSEANLIDRDNDVTSSNDERTSLWKDDSGATDHCCNERELFSNFTPCKVKLATAGEADTIQAEGIGLIEFIDHQGRPSALDGVLYVPQLRHNLFSSLKAVMEGNYEHVISTKGVVLRDASGEVILGGEIQPNASIIIKLTHPVNHRSANTVEWDEMISKKKPEELRKMHVRLGHRHISPFDRDCEYCLSIKTTAQKYKKYGDPTIIKGRVFVDLQGPFGAATGVHGYSATIVVDESDETISLILDKKSDFFEEWLQIYKKLENAYDQKLKVFQCDGGGEFVNSRMLKWLTENGVKLVQSNAYAHSQNAIVERRNRTLRESALTMCLMANMNFDVYWPSAISCAAFLMNLLKSGRTQVIPYQMKVKKEYPMETLRPYGHIGFMHVSIETRHKNDQRGVKVRLLGYTGNGYFLEDSQGAQKCSRDVRWLKENTSLKLQKEFLAEESSDEDSPATEVNGSQKDNESEEFEDEASFHTANSRTSGETERDARIQAEHVRQGINPGNILQSKRHREQRYEIDTIYRDMQYSEAMLENDKPFWIEGVKNEFSNLVALKSFLETELPANRKAIRTRWVMHRKQDGRYRPRLVVKGFEQVFGVDYTNSHASVAGYHIFRLTLSIAATQNLQVETYDCSTAFAQNDLEEEVFIYIPEGYEEYCLPTADMKSKGKSNGNKVLLLKKAMNGLVQGAHNQYKKVESELTQEGSRSTSRSQV
jgi:hypothetical protein